MQFDYLSRQFVTPPYTSVLYFPIISYTYFDSLKSWTRTENMLQRDSYTLYKRKKAR